MAGTPAVLFPPEDRVKLARAGASPGGAVVEPPSPTGGVLGRWGRKSTSPVRGDRVVSGAEQRLEIAGGVLRRADEVRPPPFVLNS